MKKQNNNHKIVTAFEDITPELAKKYLARNVANRNLRETTIKSYEVDMRSGNWVPTHQGIAFDDRGNLIDGQHRLTAIVRSGVTIQMLVTSGLPVESGHTKTMDVVDRGVVRSIADQLKLQHGFRNPNRDVGAMMSIIHMILAGKSRRITVPQILPVLEIYGRHIADVGIAVDRTMEKKFRRSVLVGAIAFARAAEPRLVDQFFAGLISGASLDANNPLLALRNFLLSDASQIWTVIGTRSQRTALGFVVLNSLRRFIQEEPGKDVYSGNAGYVFFAKRQPDNVEKIAKTFVCDPPPLDPEPEQPVRNRKALAKFVEPPAPRFVKTASDIGGISPAAEALISRAGASLGKNRVNYMRDRVRSGALEE
jgi:hypothetical protein